MSVIVHLIVTVINNENLGVVCSKNYL